MYTFSSVTAPVLTVQASSVTSTTIPLTWTSAGSVVDGYGVEWTYDGDCSGVSGGSASVGGNETSFTIERLEEFSPYSISVNTSNFISSAVSNTATGMTSEAGMFLFQVCFTAECHSCVSQTVPSAAPSSVSATGSVFNITVQWGPVDCVDQNGNITGYSVRYGTVGSELRETVTVQGGTTITGFLTGLNSSTTYSVEVAAVNGAGIGVYSGPINQTTLGRASIILLSWKCNTFSTVTAPVLTVQEYSVTSTTIPLTWTSAGSVVDGYGVEWTYDGDCSGVNGGSASVGGNETSFTIERLEEFSPYSISVNTSNFISSAVSNTATGMTSEAGMFLFQVCFTAECHSCVS